MGRYRKVETQLYADRKFRSLSRPPPNAQTLWLYLLTGPETTIVPGLISVGRKALAEALNWELEKFEKCFQELVREEMCEADWGERLVFIPNAIKYNPPESPNVIKSWFTTYANVPECALKSKALLHIAHHVKGLHKAFRDSFREAFAFQTRMPFLKTMPNQEQEQEQYLLREKNSSISKRKTEVLDRHRGDAENLWAKQEALRIEIGLSPKPRPATEERIVRIAERIEAGATVEQCEHVLLVISEQARERVLAGDKKFTWFDGVTNWRPDPFERALGQPPPNGKIESAAMSEINRHLVEKYGQS